MIIDADEIKAELGLKPFGQKGWWKCGDKCPFCGKGEKSAILFTKDSAIFHCFKCGVKTNIVSYLRAINRKDLIQHEYNISKKDIGLIPLERDEEKAENVVSETKLPYGLKPLVNDEYLDERHFLPIHYKEFEPSYTDSPLEDMLAKNNYIVFKLKDRDRVIAWLARTRYSKEWHKENLRLYKKREERLVLRYRNSEDGFSHVVGGINFVGEKTETVILVEGLFDKVNVDYLLNLSYGDSVACCFTFGKKISDGQIRRLRETNIKNIFLLYDEDALQESKENSLILNKYFHTFVCRIKDKEIDPGNMDIEYLDNVLRGAVDPQNFYLNNLESISYGRK